LGVTGETGVPTGPISMSATRQPHNLITSRARPTMPGARSRISMPAPRRRYGASLRLASRCHGWMETAPMTWPIMGGARVLRRSAESPAPTIAAHGRFRACHACGRPPFHQAERHTHPGGY